ARPARWARWSRIPRPANTGSPSTEPDSITCMSISEAAPAKIHLALHVVGRRADGYRRIESHPVFTRFGDRLSVEEAAADEFDITGPFATAIPGDGANLVLRARDLLRARFALPPVRIVLEKNLPPASGIGGGSSDAAATLKA